MKSSMYHLFGLKKNEETTSDEDVGFQGLNMKHKAIKNILNLIKFRKYNYKLTT